MTSTESDLHPSGTVGVPPKSVTRQQLYDWVWSEPMLRTAERFKVSSSYMARVCTELRVPRPHPGYWQQVEFGKAPPVPALPTERPGDVTEWNPGTSVGTTVRSILKARIEAMDESAGVANAPKRHLSRKVRTLPKGTANQTHELLIGAKQHFAKTRKSDNGLLKPFKRRIVDVMSSESMLDKVLKTAQFLYSALEAKGYRVGYSALGVPSHRAELELLDKEIKRHHQPRVWSPDGATVVYVGEAVIGLTLFEMLEGVEVVYVKGQYLPVRDLTGLQLSRYVGSSHWRSNQEMPSGRLCLAAYCASWRVKWTTRWQENKPDTFRRMVPGIIRELVAAAPDLARQTEEARLRAEEEQRRWEEEWRRREIEAERQRKEKALQDSKRDLMAVIARWDEVRRVQAFFGEADVAVEQLTGDARLAAEERLRLARELVGKLDAIESLQRWKAPDERM